MKWKLQTSKRGGCQGQSCKPGQLGTYNMELGCFQTGCPCLAQNTECDACCSCKPPVGSGDAEGCANRAASMRQVLQLGQDVQEIDSWGLDCYTRKNIQDGTASHLLAAAGRWYLACQDSRPASCQVCRRPSCTCAGFIAMSSFLTHGTQHACHCQSAACNVAVHCITAASATAALLQLLSYLDGYAADV